MVTVNMHWKRMTEILLSYGQEKKFVVSIDRDCLNSLVNNESYEVMKHLISNKVYLEFKSTKDDEILPIIEEESD